MELVHIHSLQARYRLPPRAQGERRRLDRVLHQVLDEGLERAARAAGIAPDEEVCVRWAAVRVRMRLSGPDAVLTDDWSRALAAELARLIAVGRSDEVARYRSRAHAIDELVEATARGDWRRAWAWRQLGLPSSGRAGRAIARAITERPEAIVVLLRERVRAGGFAALAGVLGVEDWYVLADRALQRAGSESLRDWIAAPRAPGRAPAAVREELGRQVERVRRGSIFLRAALERAGDLPEGARRAVAALALLDGEPALSRRADAAELAAAVERALAPRVELLAPEPAAAAPRVEPAIVEPAAARAPVEPSQILPNAPAAPAAPDPSPREAGPREVAPPAAQDAPPREAAPREVAPPAAHDAPPREVSPREVSPPAPDAAPSLAPDAAPAAPPAAERFARLRGFTQAGGLLFFLHLAAEIDLPDEALALPALAARNLRWILYRLARRLAALGPLDPAALAFAGLPPRGELPDELDGDPTAPEADALAALASRLTAALARRLEEESADLDALVAATCRRRANVVADPGWIEIHLALDEVTVPVRRAGLDLDPGFVPWLGVVVRFVYGS